MDLLKIFLIVFGTIALVEITDRTNFALIALAARQSPSETWWGAAGAFTAVTAIGVAIGAALLAAIGGRVEILRVGGGIVLLGYAGYLYFAPEPEVKEPSAHSAWTTAFILIFLLELGDTTMIFAVLFVAALGAPIIVWGATSLGLVLVAAAACLIGSRLGARVEPKVLERLTVVILSVVGVLTILYGLFPSAFPTFG